VAGRCCSGYETCHAFDDPESRQRSDGVGRGEQRRAFDGLEGGDLPSAGEHTEHAADEDELPYFHSGIKGEECKRNVVHNDQEGRRQDVVPEDVARIAGREIALGDHRPDVSDLRAEHEDREHDDGGEPKAPVEERPCSLRPIKTVDNDCVLKAPAALWVGARHSAPDDLA
jgi:hypothetical protein